MSLRVRILLSIVAVNLAVTALLASYLVADLRARARAESAAAAELEAGYVHKFEQMFDGTLRVSGTPDEQEKVASAIRELRNHAVRAFVKDGVVLYSETAAGPSLAELTAESAIPANAVYMNLLGARHRAPNFDDRRARLRIREAISEGRNRSETDPDRRGWIAAPIRLGAPGRDDPDAPIWGGGYFLLDLPVERLASPATLQPRTLIWGMAAGTLILLGLTWLLLERSVLRPLADLSAGAERVARRVYEPPVAGAGSDEIGRVVGTFNVMMADVRDAERRLTEKVDEATRQAAERGRGLIIAQRLAATGTLASGIAHEINNPLGGMLNAALKLKQDAEREAAGMPAPTPVVATRLRYVGLLVDGLERVQEIVRRVLRFTPRRVEPAVIGVLDLVRTAVAFAEHRAKKARVVVKVEGENAPVLVEPGEMQQVFLNLVLNACDAMADHGGGHVTVSARVAAGKVAVAVADDGPGMTHEQQERCFDLFFTTKEVGTGTGLGLSVAHHIIEQHQGSIAVHSEPGHGATFIVTLPLAAGTLPLAAGGR